MKILHLSPKKQVSFPLEDRMKMKIFALKLKVNHGECIF